MKMLKSAPEVSLSFWASLYHIIVALGVHSMIQVGL